MIHAHIMHIRTHNTHTCTHYTRDHTTHTHTHHHAQCTYIHTCMHYTQVHTTHPSTHIHVHVRTHTTPGSTQSSGISSRFISVFALSPGPGSRGLDWAGCLRPVQPCLASLTSSLGPTGVPCEWAASLSLREICLPCSDFPERDADTLFAAAPAASSRSEGLEGTHGVPVQVHPVTERQPDLQRPCLSTLPSPLQEGGRRREKRARPPPGVTVMG